VLSTCDTLERTNCRRCHWFSMFEHENNDNHNHNNRFLVKSVLIISFVDDLNQTTLTLDIDFLSFSHTYTHTPVYFRTYWAMRPRFSTKQDYETTILEAIQSSGFCGNGSCTLPNPVHLLLDHDPTVKMKYYTTMGIVSASFVAVFLAKFTYYLC